MEYRKHRKKRFLSHLISLPIIYSVALPLLIADIWVELYHRICFRFYKLKLVKRSDHIRIDRHKLQYLNPFEKMNCAYCGYANGLVSYWTEISGRTEKYFCGIMHNKYDGFKAPKHHKDFARYGDKEDLKNRYS